MLPTYEEHGTGSPLLLLHPFPFSRKIWGRNAEGLADAGYRVILPDHRGFGDNRAVADISRMSDMACDAAELLDHLGIEKAAIGGLSMGGYVALALYSMRPELFSSIILCDTSAAPDTDEKRKGRAELAEKVIDSGVENLLEGYLGKMLAASTKTERPGLFEEIKDRMLSADPNGVAAALLGMAERADSVPMLSSINVPACLIFGEDDELTDLKAARVIEEGIKGAELNIISGAGHLSNVEKPDEFNSILIDFLDRVTKRA